MKTIFFTLVSIFFLSICLQGQISTKGLVLYLPLDGNTNDLSRFENNGTNHGAIPSTDRFGRSNKAMYFDGHSYIDVPGIKELDLTDNKSVSCWIYIPSSEIQNWYPTIIHKDEPIKSSTYSLQLTDYFGYNSDQYKLDFFYASNDTHYQVHTKQQYTNYKDQWIHVAGTYDTISGNSKIYLNGLLSDSVYFGKVISNSSNLNLYIGSSSYNAYRFEDTFFKGFIDDVRIYNRALSASEINQLYNEELCVQNISVTDTLIINLAITGFNPVSYNGNIKVFPNPAKDQLIIQSNTIKSQYSIKIIDSLSQFVYQTTINQPQYSVNLRTWKGKGTYFVQVYDSVGVLIDVKKIIIQ